MASEGVESPAKKQRTGILDHLINAAFSIGDAVIAPFKAPDPIVKAEMDFALHQQAKALYAYARETLLHNHEEIFKLKPTINSFKSDAKEYAQLLNFSGLHDWETENNLAIAIIHYLANIKGGKQILDEAFEEGPIKIVFGCASHSKASWEPRYREITVEFNGDFEKLTKLFLNPPPVHIDKFYNKSSEEDALWAIIYEFYNAAASKMDNVLISYSPLLFNSKTEFAMVMEYMEFKALSRGDETRPIFKEDGVIVNEDFAQWYESTCKSTYQFKKFKSHAEAYEDVFTQTVDFWKSKIDFFLNTVAVSEGKLRSYYISAAEKVVEAAKKVTLRKYHHELGIDKLEIVIASSKMGKQAEEEKTDTAVLPMEDQSEALGLGNRGVKRKL